MSDVTAITDKPLELGEGARLVDGRLVLVDILAGTLYEHRAGSPALRTLASVDVPLGAVAPVRGRPGTWIASAGDGIALLTPGQPLDWIARPEQRQDGRTRMNDGCCDPRGRFWAGSMAYDGTTPAGSLYRVEPGGRVEQVLGDLAIANGPAFSPDGSTMYIADSGRATVTRYAVADDGSLNSPRLILEEESGAAPDGMTTDASGTVWVAMFGGGQVRRYSPDGELLAVVTLPARQPTSVAIAQTRAFITTARTGLGDPAPQDGLVLSFPLDGIADVGGEAALPFG
jgi:sugar lactone lactonase YvrE